MAKMIAFCGWSGSGKTTYLEKLIRELTSRGLRIAAIKHDGHDCFSGDEPTTDTGRLSSAGAAASAVISETRCTIHWNQPVTVEDLAAQFAFADLILLEGFKTGNFPKIGILRSESGKPLTGAAEDFVAIVSDTLTETSCPVFPLNDAAPMADYLISSFLREESPL